MRGLVGLGLLTIGLTLGGCAVAAGSIVYDQTKDREAREQFAADFRQRNIERVQAGQVPLDWCGELYRAKPKWYAQDARCRKA